MLKIEALKPRVEGILQNQNGAFRTRDKDFVLELGQAVEESGWALPRVADFLGLSDYQLHYFRQRYRKLSNGDSRRLPNPKKMRFKPVHIQKSRSEDLSTGFVVRLSSGVVCECGSAQGAADLMKALA